MSEEVKTPEVETTNEAADFEAGFSAVVGGAKAEEPKVVEKNNQRNRKLRLKPRKSRQKLLPMFRKRPLTRLKSLAVCHLALLTKRRSKRFSPRVRRWMS